MNPEAQHWIDKLGLLPHPEGGWYRELYRSEEVIPQAALAARYTGDRSMATSIYFLLETDSFSAFHRLLSDEIWHFHQGDPLTLQLIDPAGMRQEIRLGVTTTGAPRFQAILPAGHWFAASVDPGGSYSLVGCSVAPGFDFRDFELGECDALLEEFPEHAELIRSYTRS